MVDTDKQALDAGVGVAGMIPYIGPAIQAGYGIYQMFNTDEPGEVNYKIPPEVLQALDVSKRRAYGEANRFRTQRETLESRGAAAAGQLRDIGGAAAMGGIGDIQANISAGTREIDMMEEDFRYQAEGRYLGQLENVAQYRDKAFEYNVADPNERAWNEYYNKRAAGTQNLWSGVSGGMSLLAEMENNKRLDERLDKILAVHGSGDNAGAGDFQFNEDIMSYEEGDNIFDFGYGDDMLDFDSSIDDGSQWGDTLKGI